MIPEAAVEALMDAAHDSGFVLKRSLARDWLEAAAPHMLREAWDEGSVAGWVESGLPHSWQAENSLRNDNPYRTTK